MSDHQSSKKEIPSVDHLTKIGSLGLLATGYRGILAWKEKRGPLPKKPEPVKQEETKK